MKPNFVICAFVLTVCLVTVGCGDNDNRTVTSPTPAPAPAPTLNLAGTWTGRFTVQGETSECCQINSWTATQSGASVSGPMVIDVGEGLVNATLTGTVSGSQLTSATFTVAAGGIPDPSLASCSIRGTGTLAATATSISGPLAITITPPAAPCVGSDGILETPTGTFTFSLTK